MLLTWHWAHCRLVCAPVSGKPVVEWSKVALVQVVVLWHCWQVCGNPELTWFGLVVPWKSFRWQLTHAVFALVRL